MRGRQRYDLRRVRDSVRYYLSPIQQFNEDAQPWVFFLALAGAVGVTFFLPWPWGVLVVAVTFFALGVIAVYRLIGPRVAPVLSFAGDSPAENVVTRTRQEISLNGTLSVEQRYVRGRFTRAAISNRRDGMRTAHAAEAHATLRYFDAAMVLLFDEPTARWSGNPDVGTVPEVDLQTTRIAAGGQGTVDLLVRYDDEPEVYPWGNHGARDVPMPVGTYFIYLEVDDPELDEPLVVWMRAENDGIGFCSLTPLESAPETSVGQQ